MPVQFVTGDNLGNTFELDTVNKKVNVKIDNDTIVKRSDGTLRIDTSSSEFVLGVKSGETVTTMTGFTDPTTNARILRYVSESGLNTDINLTDLVADIHIDGAELDGDILVLHSNSGAEYRVDLSKYTTDAEVEAKFDLDVLDVFDVPQGKMRGV
jgi:hypothetical protein